MYLIWYLQIIAKKIVAFKEKIFKFAYKELKNMITARLTENQIRALIYFGLDHDLSITDIYKLCYPDSKVTDIVSTASMWKRGKKVTAIFESVKNEIERKRVKMAEELSHDKNGNLSQIVDFTDKSEFIKYLNQAANRITDDKLKNDILKMLSDHLDFKDESKRDESNQIQRFYLPLRCQDCNLYQEWAKSVTL